MCQILLLPKLPLWCFSLYCWCLSKHDGVIKWKHFPCYWPFVRGIHRSPANSPQKDQWRRVLMFCLICTWTNGWVNNWDAGDFRRHRANCDVIVIWNFTGPLTPVCLQMSEQRTALDHQQAATHILIVMLALTHCGLVTPREHQRTGSAFGELIACRLSGAKPLS